MIELVKDKEIGEIIIELKKLQKEKAQFKYNIFTLSSYNNQLENFHSDVIASFLDPEGLHGQNRLFLDAFLEYLKDVLELEIEISDFNDAKVEREKKRLDILISDKTTKKAIIFENKINNAPDMDKQLFRYYKSCIDEGNFVPAILYVTLRGIKKAPSVEHDIKKVLRNVAFFSSDSGTDLITGWLEPTIEKCSSDDTKSLARQYCKLVKYLGFESKEKGNMDKFYESIAKEEGLLGKIENFIELTEKIPSYRADCFQSSIEDYSPFEKSYRYRPNYVLFEDCVEGNNKFKIDVIFNDDGSAEILFWNPGRNNKEGNEALVAKVEQISFQDKMKLDQKSNRYSKKFKLTEYKTMEFIDSETIKFTEKLIKSLRK